MAKIIATKNKKFVLKDGHKVQEVFTLNGIKYFEFVDSNMAPVHRMYMGMTYYNELQMRCDRDYLIAHSQALIDCINGQSEGNKGIVDITKISQLALQLKERVEWILEPDSIYKYASVVMFDETEDPYSYDMKYNNEVKIPLWKKQEPASFFLSMPVKRLFPLLDLPQKDLEAYLKVQEKIKEVHLQDITILLSKESKMKDFYNTLVSRRQKEQPLAK